LWLRGAEMWAPSEPALHPKYPELGLGDGSIQSGGKPQSQYPAGVCRVNNPVVPQACAGVIGVRLAFELINDWLFKFRGLLRRPGFALAGQAVFTDLCQYPSRLLATHYGNFGVRPHPEETGAVRSEEHTSELQSRE